MFNIVLVAPEIPANTGNIGRTCVVTGSRLHLVGPLGFSLDEHSLRRAGLGYWESLDVTLYESWDEFVKRNRLSAGDARLHLLTKKARRTYAEARYADGDYLVFGCESVGLPEELLAAHARSCERIPMLADALSTTLFVAGPEEALDFWRSREDFELVLCTQDNRVIVTEGLEAGYRPAGEDRGYTYEIARR